MEAQIKEYISHELNTKPEQLSLTNETPLLETGLLDSLAVLKLVIFVEEQFGVVVSPDDFIPENFQTVNTICTFIRTLQQAQGVQR